MIDMDMEGMDMSSNSVVCPVCGRKMENGTGTFGARLRQVMDEKKVVNSTLAEWVGVSPACVSNYRADANMPTAITLAKIARYLGVTVEWLVFGEEESWSGDAVLDLLKSSGCDYQSSGDGYLLLIDATQLRAVAEKLNEMEGK